MKVISCGDPNYKTIQFEWFLTNWCNFKCTYCSEVTRLITQFDKQKSPTKHKLVLSRLKNIKDLFVIELIGGEPTLHPNIDEIISELELMEYCKEVQLITNLSRPVHFYNKFDSGEYKKLSILCSFHPEFYKDEWLEKVLEFKDFKNIKFTIVFNLIDKKEYWPLTLKVLQELKDNNVRFAYNILSSTPRWSPNYTTEFYETFNQYLDTGKFKENISYNFDDGSTNIFHEGQIIEKKLHYLKNYLCTPIRYRITHEGDIHNFCNNRKLPLLISSNDLYKKERCINECCGCDAVFKFYKEL